jgi:hypothetical protein
MLELQFYVQSPYAQILWILPFRTWTPPQLSFAEPHAKAVFHFNRNVAYFFVSWALEWNYITCTEARKRTYIQLCEFANVRNWILIGSTCNMCKWDHICILFVKCANSKDFIMLSLITISILSYIDMCRSLESSLDCRNLLWNLSRNDVARQVWRHIATFHVANLCQFPLRDKFREMLKRFNFSQRLLAPFAGIAPCNTIC